MKWGVEGGGIAQDLVHPRSGRTDRRGGGAEGNVATAQRRPAHDARDQARRQSSLRLGLRHRCPRHRLHLGELLG